MLRNQLKNYFIIAGSCTLLLSSIALAETPPMDSGKTGMHSMDQMHKSGMMGKAEMATNGIMDHKNAIKNFDTDSDGKVSQDEYLASQKQEFARFDKDSNGSLDLQEQAALAKSWSVKG